MATKSAGEFRNGMTLEIDGKVCQVMEFMHVKPGKGSGICPCKIKRYHQRWCGRDNLPSDRVFPGSIY